MKKFLPSSDGPSDGLRESLEEEAGKLLLVS